MHCTLNVYGSDAVVREDLRGVEKTPTKSGSLLAFHTHRLSFIGIDIILLEIHLVSTAIVRVSGEIYMSENEMDLE